MSPKLAIAKTIKLEYLRPYEKIFAFAVENTFSRYAGTCLKFILQNIILHSLRFQVVIFDLPQTGITKNEKIRIFSDLKKKTF